MNPYSLALLLLAATASASEPEALEMQLPAVSRVYVEKFGGGDSAAQLRDMIIASVQKLRVFVLTESADRADAVLRGSGEDLVFTEVFQSGDSITARAGVSMGRGSSYSRSGRESVGLQGSVGENENMRIQERKHEASASVRLVNREGDVIWSTTQESQGAKFRSASADVAEKVARQLLQDLERTRRPRPTN
ncbi:MAG TPA: hypothetical protein PKJ41_20280 [Bryobacteraceae bacterium]|nr:hypothetical protein [Bryobacteraceae bacterium]HPT26141.1 hypothetical protein [Bryobacteraceae bacterium]